MSVAVEISDERLKKLNISRDDYEEVKRIANAREENVPQVGDAAPEFDLQLLTASGEPTGETVSLSSLRGQPVMLYFGSFT